MRYLQTVLLSACVLAVAITPDFSRAQNGYAVTERGADYRVLQKTTIEHGTNHVHQYTELATGLNYQNSYGQWTESQEQISILPTGGAAAVQGQHKVYFPPDIYDGLLEVVTPDGRHLKSRPLGVSYDDGSNTVFIATLQHSQGLLTSSNQVTYPDAFTDIKADLVCTYRKSGFECDLVFRQQPPAPDQYGLDDSSSTLQLVTEFFNTADPQQVPAANDEWFGLQDSTLKFGKLTMTHGKAFAVKSSNSQLPSAISSSPVYKRWLHLQGRTFLIEELPLVNLADDLQTLPEATNVLTSKVTGKLRMASNHLQMPPAHELVADTRQILIASTGFNQKPGVVLDYTTVDSGPTDFTFESGTTYYIDDLIYLSGTVTFEGGAVIKFYSHAPNGAVLYTGAILCPTNSDTPVILTSSDDNSVGQTISGSSGSPSIGGCLYLAVGEGFSPLNNLRFAYTCLFLTGMGDVDLWNCQFLHIPYAIETDDNSVLPMHLHNILFADCDLAVAGVYYDYDSGGQQTISAEQVTSDTGYFVSGSQAEDTLFLTNCIILGSMGGYAGTVTTDGVAFNPAGTIFKTAANANYYLTNGSPYRDVGTTGIDSDLLADIQTMTTYTPQDGGLPDTDTPDYGYHYPVNEDSDYDGLPDWWEYKYFGSYAYSGTNLDGMGDNTLHYDYQNGLDPNIVLFSVQFTNNYYTANPAYGTIGIQGGEPFYEAVLVNDTNQADAIWEPFTTTNVTVDLSNGLCTVSVGLRGLPADAQPNWREVQLTLNTTPLMLAVTNPAGGTVSQPMIQLQGFASKPLGSLAYDISNATGIFTNQTGYLTGEFYDTDLQMFTTNYFQGYDISLAGGLNTITLHATDLTGNTATTNFNFTLDYSGGASPSLAIIWPQDGTPISGSNFTAQAQVSDPTATVTATVNGSTVQGLVERNGLVWVNALPLNAGANAVTLTASNIFGGVSSTNFNVIGNDVGLVINPLTSDQMNQQTVTVTGTVNVGDAVTVNGVTASVNDDTGNWSATVTVNPAGTASLNVQVTDSSNNPLASQTLNQSQPVTVVLADYQLNSGYDSGTSGHNQTVQWDYLAGGNWGTTDYSEDEHLIDPAIPPDGAGYAPPVVSSDYGETFMPTWQNANATYEGGRTYHTSVQTTVMITPSDPKLAGMMETYRVCVSAMQFDPVVGLLDGGDGSFYSPELAGGSPGNVPVPSAQLRINGQPLADSVTNDDGSIWGETIISAPAGELVPLTVTTSSSDYNDYTFNVTAQDVNLQLAVDANRDGNITFDSADQTTDSQPYRFWVNDDEDVGNEDVVPPSSRDCDDFVITGPRDLEDMSRLHLLVQGITNELANGTFLIGLKWKNVITGSPSINIFPAVETNGGTLYLTDTNVAAAQAPGITLQTTVLDNQNDYHQVDTSGTFLINSNFWNGFAGDKKYLLFEGCSLGKGQLVVTVNKPDGTEIAEAGSVWLDIKNIKSMYQRAVATPSSDSFTPPYNTSGSSFYTNHVFDESNLGYSASTSVAFDQPSDETPQCVVFVHGWRMSENDYINFSETMFKRLYWQGYKGRFCSFYWETLTSYNSFNTSEFRAWKYGLSLKKYVDALKTSLPDYSMNIVAHSMGNTVVGSALHRGLTVDNYVLMQAALPAGCYDTSSGINNYPRFATDETDSPTPDLAIPNMGYRGYLTNVTGNLVNFFNTNDFALATGDFSGISILPWPYQVNWEANQESYKPDSFTSTHYAYDSTQPVLQSGQFIVDPFGPTLDHYVTDPQEMMSFVARSRSQAVGAKHGISGKIGSEVDLTGSFGFRGNSDEHSAEFNWNIQWLGNFYLILGQKLRVFPEE